MHQSYACTQSLVLYKMNIKPATTDVHANEVLERMLELAKAPIFPNKTANIVSILFSNRSGSTFLSSLLNNSQNNNCLAGEFFSPKWLFTANKNFDLTPNDLVGLIQNLADKGVTIFLKSSYFHYINLVDDLPSLPELIERSCLVRLKRKDVKAQVLSRVAARMSGNWHEFNRGPNVYYNPNVLHHDPITEVMQSIAFTIGCEVGWDIFLDDLDFSEKVLTIFYEDLSSDPLYVLNQIETLACVPKTQSIDISNPRVTRKINSTFDISAYSKIYDQVAAFMLETKP